MICPNTAMLLQMLALPKMMTTMMFLYQQLFMKIIILLWHHQLLDLLIIGGAIVPALCKAKKEQLIPQDMKKTRQGGYDGRQKESCHCCGNCKK